MSSTTVKERIRDSVFSASPTTNPDWKQSSGGNSSLENEWSNLDSNP